MLKYINGIPNAPEAIGDYSQAVISENTVYISGQLPLDPKTGLCTGENIEQQMEQIMKNLISILGHMGCDFTHVIKTTIYTTNLSQIHVINRVYSKWLGALRPARTVLGVSSLPLGAFVEVDIIAELGKHDELLHFRPADEEALKAKEICIQEMQSRK